MSDTITQLRALLKQMIPSEASVSADLIADWEPSIEYPEEVQHLANAVAKRRNEFIAGRRCARAALAQVGIGPCALLTGKDRTPQWPKEVVGSISHTVGLCCAVVARSESIACIGVDLETTTRISPGVIERILHPLETNYVGVDQARGSLFFSAKEAFFKAQFPTWAAWPNFDDLAFEADELSARLKVIQVAPTLPESLQSAAWKMNVRYAFFSHYILTICWLENATFETSELQSHG